MHIVENRLVLKVVAGCLGLICLVAIGACIFKTEPDQAAAVDSLNLHCNLAFGFDYTTKSPPDHFGDPVPAPMEHDAGLQALELKATHLLNDSLNSNESTLNRLLVKLAEDPHDSTRVFLLASACTQAWTICANQGGSFWTEGRHRYWKNFLRWLLATPGDSSIRAKQAEHSYEWMRVRFLIAGSMYNNPNLIPLGRRLLEEKPDDFEVMKVLIEQLGLIRTESATSEALKLCHAGIAKWPNSPVFYSLESYTYLTRWLGLGKHRADGELMIRSTRQAISRLPAGATVEDGLKSQVKYMTVDLASHN